MLYFLTISAMSLDKRYSPAEHRRYSGIGIQTPTTSRKDSRKVSRELRFQTEFRKRSSAPSSTKPIQTNISCLVISFLRPCPNGPECLKGGKILLESKLLPAVSLLLRTYFLKTTVTITVLKFGWIHLITVTVTVTVLASAVTPSFPLIPNYHLESNLS